MVVAVDPRIEALRRHNISRRIIFDDVLRAALFRLRNGMQLGWIDVAEEMGIGLTRLMQEVYRLRAAGFILAHKVPKKER